MSILVVNFKDWPEADGERAVELAKAAEAAARENEVEIAVAPARSMLSEVAKKVSIPVLSQYLDGRENVEPVDLFGMNVKGSILNHSDHPIPDEDVRHFVAELNKFDMISIVCAKSAEDVARYARMGPTHVAIEPAELIGTGRAVSREMPELVEGSVIAIQSVPNDASLLCGAGISSGEDVARALELGADGVLVSSAIVRAENWGEKLDEFAKSLKK